MSSLQKTFLILDGNALLHRAWHAIPPLTRADGTVVNAVYGFLMVVEKMKTEFSPDYMAVAWDLPGATFRHQEYEAYKGTREKKSQELYDQIPMIQDFLEAYKIPSLSAPGFEGDDILGTMSTANEKKNIKTLIVTGDLDALQLVSPLTEVVFFVKGLSVTKRYTPKTVQERYGLLPAQLVDYKALVGDSSDNLPGIAGIGAKTAEALLLQYQTIEGIFTALQKGMLPIKFEKKFYGQEERVAQMKRLVTIVRDVPLENFQIQDAQTQEADVPKLRALFQAYEFKTLDRKYESVALSEPKAQQKTIVALPKAERNEHKETQPALPGSPLSSIALDRIGIVLTERPQDLFGGGIGTLAITDGSTIHVLTNPSTKEIQDVLDYCGRAKVLVGHDFKAMFHVLAAQNLNLSDLLSVPLFDTLVAAYLLASGDREFAYSDVVRTYLSVTFSDEATTHGALGPLLPLASTLQKKLAVEGMEELARDVEMPLIPVLFRMEEHGFAVDGKLLQDLSRVFEERLKELTAAIYLDAGREFNINSPSQLAEVLFVDLGIETNGIKKTKTGFSTAAPELEKIVERHEIVKKISEYRELAKLKGTYADTLPKLVDNTGRIHTRFNQCIAATGRLSSSDPNLQNIPIRSSLGREIRKAFIAPPGYVLVSADYSQIELRLAASIANDASFIQAFKDGADIHKRTAAEMWNIDESAVTKEQRYAAKAINFGILYGIGPRALGKSAGVRMEEAKEFIERYFLAHPGIRAYLDAMKLQAHQEGFVTSLYGRRRYLPDVNSGVPQLVASAERMAINMPIQATQADIIKKAMITIDRWLKDSKLDAKMIAQVHDELVFEVAEKDVDVLVRGVSEHMRSLVTLAVPLVVDVAVEKSWGEME